MTLNNEYINIVKSDKNILSIESEIYKNKWKWTSFFKNSNEIYLEIWTWLWNFFSIEWSQNKDKNFIWMEIKYKRLFKTAEKSRNIWLENFVVLKDFGQNIDKIFNIWEISKTYIFFPDPWDNKDRQKKHKLLQLDFLKKLFDITKSGWKVYFKTDHKNYFDETLELIKTQNKFEIWFLSYDYEKESDFFDKQKLTEFESMFRWDKLKINYAEFIKP